MALSFGENLRGMLLAKRKEIPVSLHMSPLAWAQLRADTPAGVMLDLMGAGNRFVGLEVVEDRKLTGTRWYALNADGEKVAEGGRDA